MRAYKTSRSGFNPSRKMRKPVSGCAPPATIPSSFAATPGTLRPRVSPSEHRWRECAPLPPRRAAAECGADTPSRAFPLAPAIVAQFLRSERPRKQPLQQRPQIQPRSPTHNRQMFTRRNFAQNLPRLPRIFSSRNGDQRVGQIQQVMRCFRSLLPRRLGRANLERGTSPPNRN